jgi:starch synthase
MKVAVVAAEMTPYAKAGGLADVIGALPAELEGCGAEVCVVIPGYKTALAALPTVAVGDEYSVMVGPDREPFRVRSGVGAGGVPIFFIVHDGYFGRDGIYGEDGRDYPDAAWRYIFFSRAAARALVELIKPDVVHAHDWHSALLPIVMRADPALRPAFDRTASLFTIHNMAFQGLLEASQFPLLNIDRSYMTVQYLEFYARVNLMKGAVVLADAASTVSPTYAREVSSDPQFGFGLEGVLSAKGSRFVGILNGADYNEWNPAADSHIAARYSPADPSGKAVCTRDLRRRMKLPLSSRRPLVGMVSRMTAQKGFDLLVQALDDMMELDLDLVVLGSGEPEIEGRFQAVEKAHPDRMRTVVGFDNELAHRIQAGCDLFLMPSRFEPCGLTQMYALKYGTAPVVRATGGLADTVAEFDPVAGSGNGFVFENYVAQELIAALRRALRVFADPPHWRRLMANCFAADFSWAAAATRYMELFQELVAARRRTAR